MMARIIFTCLVFLGCTSKVYACSMTCSAPLSVEETIKQAEGAVLAKLKWTIPLSFSGSSYLYNVRILRSWKNDFEKSYWWRVKGLGYSCDHAFKTKGEFIAFFHNKQLLTGYCSTILPVTKQLIETLDTMMGKP